MCTLLLLYIRYWKRNFSWKPFSSNPNITELIFLCYRCCGCFRWFINFTLLMVVKCRIKMQVSARAMIIHSVLYHGLLFLSAVVAISPPSVATFEVERTNLGDNFVLSDSHTQKCKDFDGYEDDDNGKKCACYKNEFIASSSSTQDPQCTKLSGLFYCYISLLYFILMNKFWKWAGIYDTGLRKLNNTILWLDGAHDNIRLWLDDAHQNTGLWLANAHKKIRLRLDDSHHNI